MLFFSSCELSLIKQVTNTHSSLSKISHDLRRIARKGPIMHSGMAACSAHDNVRSIMSRDRSVCTRMDKMLGRKRTARSDEVPPAKKRGVSVKTDQKRITESNKEIGTSVWLKYEKADRDLVATLKCSVFNDKLRGMRNYNDVFIVGSRNLQSSSYKEHAAIPTCTNKCCFFQLPFMISYAIHVYNL